MVQIALGTSNIKSAKFMTHDADTRRSKKPFWYNKFVEFCNRTDLHGFKYIVMDEFNTFERTGWAVAVLLSMIVAAFFLVTAYNWYARNPVVTVIESTQGAIWDVPFPAITICDLNIVSKKAARELSNNLTLPANVTADSVFKSLRLIPLLYSTFKANEKESSELIQLQSILDTNNLSIDKLYKILSPARSCNHLLQRCMWKNRIYRCETIFKQIFTLLSVCCTFNYFAINEKDKRHLIKKTKTYFMNLLSYNVIHTSAGWVALAYRDLGATNSVQGFVSERVQEMNSLHLPTPRRVASCGYTTALTVLMHTNTDDYYSAAIASKGVLVIIDNAYNLPNIDSPVRMVNPSTEVLIALSPERTYSTSGIKGFPPEVRQCYYNNEVRIGQFRRYSFHNCMVYQKILLIKTTCNCSPLYFPVVDNNQRICNFNDMECMDKLVIQENDGHDSENYFKCLPECEHYNYPYEVALGKLADSVHVSGLPFFDGVTLANRSLLNVFFNDLVSTMYRRDVYLSWQNLLSSFGGLLSLMIGFTLISGLDLILFFIIRVVYSSLSWLFIKQDAVKRIDVQTYKKKDNLMHNQQNLHSKDGSDYHNDIKY